MNSCNYLTPNAIDFDNFDFEIKALKSGDIKLEKLQLGIYPYVFNLHL